MRLNARKAQAVPVRPGRFDAARKREYAADLQQKFRQNPILTISG
jgi:hypothetical protein